MGPATGQGHVSLMCTRMADGAIVGRGRAPNSSGMLCRVLHDTSHQEGKMQKIIQALTALLSSQEGVHALWRPNDRLRCAHMYRGPGYTLAR